MNRLELGGNLQGLDYTYTIHGQLKAINNSINDKDPGKDGSNGFAADVFGLQLDYNEVDYQNPGVQHNFQIGGYRPHKSAYDGRINSMRWGRPNIQPYYEYEYQPATGWLSAARYGRVVGSQKISSEAYAVENLTYDQNGNILTLKRRGTSEAPDMDKLAYTYEAASNQLAYVADEVAPGAYPHDLDGQQPNNYEYNKIGQLIFNKQDDVGYEYYTSGLTKAIYNGRVESGTKRVEFQYNESGHRIKKLSYNQEGTLLKTTFYVRDAAGTPLAIYYKDEGNTDKSVILAEQVVYGGSRLGVANRITETMLYEITDHLGNVRAVVTKGENGQPIAVLGTADYYPFGMPFPDQNNLDYRYAYQGQEKDEETNMEAFQLRLWDARIGRWLTPDPAGQHFSPYLGMGNNPISRVDPDGGKDGPGDGWFKRIFNKIFGKSGTKTDGYIDEVVVTAQKIGKAVNESFSIKNVGVDVGVGVKDFTFGSVFKISLNGSLMNLYYNDDKERLEGGILNGGVKLSIGKKLFTTGVTGSLIKASKSGYSIGKVSASGAINSYNVNVGTLEGYNSNSGWGGDTGVVLQQPPENRMVDIHGTGNREPQAIIGGTIKAGVKAKVEFNVDKFYSDMWGTGNIGTDWKN